MLRLLPQTKVDTDTFFGGIGTLLEIRYLTCSLKKRYFVKKPFTSALNKLYAHIFLCGLINTPYHAIIMSSKFKSSK